MARILACLVFAAAALAQSANPAFDLASVRVSPRATWAKTGPNAMQGGYLIGDRYEIHRATIVDLIHQAYNVDPDKIFGGPNWIDYDKFDVVAKTKPGTRQDALRQMLQSLLADRFELAVKQETQQLPAYILSAGKDQSKLKASEGASAEGCQTVPVQRTGPNVQPQNEIRCKGVTMDEFAGSLVRLGGAQYFQRLPVVDSTGIEGAFDIDIKYPALLTRINQDGSTQRENENGIFEAVDKQLGLKLEPGKAPQQVLSVAGVKEQPAADPAGVDAALPPAPPPQFEVAALRVCDQPAAASGPVAIVAPRIEPGGRVTANCYPLTILLQMALNLNGNLQDIPGLPKSLQGGPLQNRITITARAPAGSTPNEAIDASQSRDILAAMLRAFLVDRYKLAYHTEDRPMDAMTLVANKPKLTKADPSGRTGCAIANQSNVQDRKIVCRNITMAQFAEQILALYPAARYPVLDGTHLEGAWDFTIEFNPIAGLLQQVTAQAAAAAAGAGRDTPANLDSAAPSGPTTLAEAIERQIGLKLETHKRPEPVLVIDHMEDKPTDN